MGLKSYSKNNWKINLFLVFVFLATGGIVYRLFNLTFVRHSDYTKSAKAQYENPSSQLADRGNIYFSDTLGSKYLAATNQKFYYLYSNNSTISSADDVAGKLTGVLGVSKEELVVKLLPKEKKYVVLTERLSDSQADKIKSLKIAGVEAARAIERVYPKGDP